MRRSECHFPDSINHDLEKNIFAHQGVWHLSSYVPVSKNILLSIGKGLTPNMFGVLEPWVPIINKEINCVNLCVLYMTKINVIFLLMV